jgi:hypothetical protein
MREYPMQPQRQWRLLLGLEGVAIDPAPATLAVLREGLRQIGRPLPPELALDWLMDKEFEEALEYQLGSDYEHLSGAATKRVGLHYREFRRYKGRVYAGIPELLDVLSRQQEVETLLLSAWKPEETRGNPTAVGHLWPYRCHRHHRLPRSPWLPGMPEKDCHRHRQAG